MADLTRQHRPSRADGYPLKLEMIMIKLAFRKVVWNLMNAVLRSLENEVV